MTEPQTGDGRAACLEAATRAVMERGQAYGPPHEFFGLEAQRWSLTLGVEITPWHVVLCLLDMKIARASGARDPRDSLVDIAGYAACAYEVDAFARAAEAGGCGV